MKHFLIVFLFLPVFSFAQEQTEIIQPKNEVGINLFSITYFDCYKNMLDKNVTTAEFNYFSGIYYKRSFGKNAVRGSFDFTGKIFHSGYPVDPIAGSDFISASKKNLVFTAGMEHAFSTKKLQPYVFADALLNYTNTTGVRSEYGCFGPIGIFPFAEERFEYGLSAGAGIRYAITPVVHLSLETNVQGFVSTYQDVLHSYGKYVGYGFHVNPVSKLGFAVSF